MPNYNPSLVRVLEKVGGPTRLAEQLGIVASAVTQWSRVPARHVPRIEAITGIPGNRIRPDLYSAAKPKPAKHKTNEALAKKRALATVSPERTPPDHDEAA